MKFSIIVPTLNAGDSWGSWIESIKSQSLTPNTILVIDSGSVDDTVKLANEAGFNVKVLLPGTFNHGGTRKLAALQCQHHDVVIFLTQDAILADVNALNNILLPFQDKLVMAVCGRQLPRKLASPIEAHARNYNYPSKSFVRSINDVSEFGLKTAFISNSFAAYRVSALNEVGGFPENVIFGEDMHVAARILKAGYKIAYAADASVYHSHGYSFWQEMKRYFDMGVFHAREPWIRQELGGAEGEGLKFIVSEFQYLLGHAFWRIPESFLRILLRYTGFRLGLLEKHLPLRLKRMLAMNKGYYKI